MLEKRIREGEAAAHRNPIGVVSNKLSIQQVHWEWEWERKGGFWGKAEVTPFRKKGLKMNGGKLETKLASPLNRKKKLLRTGHGR